MTRTGGSVEERAVPAVVAQILAGRGMKAGDMESFLFPDYEGDLHDPFLLRDMDKAVERILAAAESGESVVVYGDYDIDGITASAVMIEMLTAIGISARSYIPDRFEEGYGINQEALEGLKADGVGLVISVDCGITSVREAQWARANGLDLIITDHHSVPEIIPEAVAVINPKRPGDLYPFKDLAGVGVAFKLAVALQSRSGKPAAGHEKWLLDLVALGTVCDVVPLVGENRVLASFGLKVLRRTRRTGIRALAAVGGVDVGRATAHHLGYVLGPRMNAAGRLDHAARSLELVMTGDTERAEAIAAELDELNRHRRSRQEAIYAAADAMAAKYASDPVLVLAHEDWSHGVVGIVASKLVEKWHKPTLVAQIMGDSTKGSARSIPGFNMVEALRAQEGLFTKFGGHFYAAGYTIPTANLDELRASFRAYSLGLEKADLEEARHADLELPDLEHVSMSLLDTLDLLEPYGNGNPQPLVEVKDLAVDGLSRIGAGQKHLKLALRDGNGRKLAAIGFGLAGSHKALKEGTHLTATGELNKNEWQGTETVQLVLRELQYD